MVEVARKLPLPEGTYAVGAGIAVAGLTGYVFLSLAFRQLTTETSKVDYTAVFGLWVILYTIAPGFFQPLEQEVGRALAHRRGARHRRRAARQARRDVGRRARRARRSSAASPRTCR